MDDATARGVHTGGHLDRLVAISGRTTYLDSDTASSPRSLEAARLAAGAAVQAVEAVMAGEVTGAMALVRPPGHHAEPDRAMGFCLLNNVAIAAAFAVEHLGCERVLVVDWDVHHGNGTQAAFYRRREVLYFSIHQWPFYPGTGRIEERGAGDGAGYTANVPLPPGHDDRDFLEDPSWSSCRRASMRIGTIRSAACV
jgi:acetoin utilization deacetylase AcuC-like enzyme